MTQQRQAGFTLIELLVTVGITALMMLAVTSLFATFLLSAGKSRLSQRLRENGTAAMSKMTELLRNANSVSSNCSSATGEGVVLTELSLISSDGLTTTLSELNDKIASSSAENGTYYLTSSSDSIEADRLRNLQFTCYATETGNHYVSIDFSLSSSDQVEANSPTASTLDFSSGVSLRN